MLLLGQLPSCFRGALQATLWEYNHTHLSTYCFRTELTRLAHKAKTIYYLAGYAKNGANPCFVPKSCFFTSC